MSDNDDDLIDGQTPKEYAYSLQRNQIWRRINAVARNERAAATITFPYIGNPKISDCLVRFRKFIDRAYKVLEWGECDRVDIILDQANGCLVELCAEMKNLGVPNVDHLFQVETERHEGRAT